MTNDVLAVGVWSCSYVSLCVAVCLNYCFTFWGGGGICGLFFPKFRDSVVVPSVLSSRSKKNPLTYHHIQEET